MLTAIQVSLMIGALCQVVLADFPSCEWDSITNSCSVRAPLLLPGHNATSLEQTALLAVRDAAYRCANATMESCSYGYYTGCSWSNSGRFCWISDNERLRLLQQGFLCPDSQLADVQECASRLPGINCAQGTTTVFSVPGSEAVCSRANSSMPTPTGALGAQCVPKWWYSQQNASLLAEAAAALANRSDSVLGTCDAVAGAMWYWHSCRADSEVACAQRQRCAWVAGSCVPQLPDVVDMLAGGSGPFYDVLSVPNAECRQEPSPHSCGEHQLKGVLKGPPRFPQAPPPRGNNVLQPSRVVLPLMALAWLLLTALLSLC